LVNSFNEHTQILSSSEIKNKSEKEKKVKNIAFIGCYICDDHFYQL